MGLASCLGRRIIMSERINGIEREATGLLESDELRIAKGLVPGTIGWRKFGHNSVVGTSYEVIGFQGGTYAFPVTTDTLTVVSASTNDTNTAGTHARKLTIEGLDGSFNAISETVNLNGTTPVVSALTYRRINRAYVSEAGAYGNGNEGAITITHTTTTATLVLIEALASQGAQAVYTVPNGQTAYVKKIFLTSESNKPATFQFNKRLSADNTTTPKAVRVISTITGVEQTVERDNYIHELFPAKTDMWFVAKVPAGTAECSAEFDFVLVAD